MPHDKLLPMHAHKGIMPETGGTYVITGGLGVLGLEVLDLLVERGARTIVLVSRNGLPPLSEWAINGQHNMAAIGRILNLEELGVHTKVVALDLSTHGAASRLQTSLSGLGLPPVRGIVHAAGVLKNQLVTDITEDAFNQVLDPKIAGALAMHHAYPASWRGLGMAASTDFIEAELGSKGITSVAREEAFQAWDHVSKYNVSHAVVLRSRVFSADEQLPMQILHDIAPRRQSHLDATVSETGQRSVIDSLPPAGAARDSYLESQISESVATVLQLPSREDVDVKRALPELGMDSVMTVAFRRQLQQRLKVKVPPTLVWGHPTVSHLIKWFAEKLRK